MNERNLLEKLIKEKLGKGKAEFEMRVGGKSIDLVFEKEDEIWIIEAKKVLNFEALGQVLTYEELYKQQFLPCKNINLAIVYEEGDPDIEQACQSKGVKVFISKETEGLPKKVEEAPICGICGSEMVLEEGEFKCKTCEYFFRMSSIARQCDNCQKMYGSFPAVEEEIYELCQLRLAVTKRPGERLPDKAKWLNYCPECRVEKLYAIHEGTYCGQIARILKEGQEIHVRLEFELERRLKFSKAKEFIKYCLGETKLYP